VSSPRFRDVDGPLPQDWPRLAAWLKAHGLHLDVEVAPRQFAGGLANLNYLISVGGELVVLRRPPDGPVAEGANDMAREARVLTRLSEHYPLAPRSIAFCDDLSVLGVSFQLIEYRDGVAIGAKLPPELAARDEAPERLTTALIDAMATLHALDPAELGLGGLGRPAGFLARQVEGWARRADAAWDGDPPKEVASIVEKLQRNSPTDEPVALLHGDLKFDNMLVDLRSLSAVAVVDWDMCTRGDPLFDLAVLASYWVDHADPAEVRGIEQVPSLEPGFPDRDGVVARYFAAVGRRPVDLSFHLALARLRLAVAWQQLYQRWQRGALTGERYQGFGVLARSVLGWTADTTSLP
jgi:aminoglycoside phosphotransferase (APT) family kinase protein